MGFPLVRQAGRQAAHQDGEQLRKHVCEFGLQQQRRQVTNTTTTTESQALYFPPLWRAGVLVDF